MMKIRENQYQKIILYAGGPPLLFPDEPTYLKDIVEAIHSKKIRGNPLILFRSHPADTIDRWKKILDNTPAVIFDSAWNGTKRLLDADVTESDLKKLCSTLAYTDVHVNLCSTMTLDGSAFHKPQIGPAYVAHNKKREQALQNMYLQDHFKPIISSGVLVLAKTKHELIDAINRALEDKFPELKQSEKVLTELITFTDGQSKNRVVKIIKNALEENVIL